MFTTLFVSAFWHGVAPGYYLTFLCVPLVVIAEVRMEKAIKPYLSPKLCYYYDWLSWFFHYRSMEYLGCGFMLLQLAPCWAAWKGVNFIGHIILLAFIIIPFFIPKKYTSDKEARKKLSWLQLWLDIVSSQNILEFVILHYLMIYDLTKFWFGKSVIYFQLYSWSSVVPV